MSDDGYDEDDYIYFDDGPYADAVRPLYVHMHLSVSDMFQDDLAEHTMPSPVWLDNEQGLDFYDVLDELLLDGDDDYFDQRHSVKRKRGAEQLGLHTSGNTDVPSKRQKPSSTEDTCGDPAPGASTPTQIVVWRTQDHDALSHPVFSDGIEAGVALLKDWRERFKDSAVSTTYGVKRRSIKTAPAVVVERRQPTEASRRIVPTSVNTKTKPLSKRKVAKPSTNDHARTTAPRETSNNEHGSATDTHRPALAQRGNTTKATSLKRKAPDVEDEDELQADHGEFAIPKKRAMTRSKGPVHPSATGVKEPNMRAPGSQPVLPNLRTQRSAVRPHTALITGAHVVDKGQTGAAITRSIKRKK